MPNTFAYAVLILWPFVTFAMFALMRPAQAVVWSLLAGYLLLPVKTSFDFPGIPALDKTSIANLSTCVAAVFATGIRVVRPPREWWVIMLMAIYLTSPMLTVLNNADSLAFGSVILPGLSPYDALSVSAYKAIDLVPFLLGYNMLRRPQEQYGFLRSFVHAALAYSLLMLVEIRLSPQLHTWIYGFFPHSFGQQVRDGGFRAVVFLGHGLVVAIFTAMAVTAAGYLARRRIRLYGVSSWLWLLYLVGILILCKSLGALVLAITATMIVASANRKVARSFCALAAIVVVVYPALRGADLVPVQTFANIVAEYSGERAGSFQTRIDNEDQLLNRAAMRPWFGWGGYGRNRVLDADTGKDLSITDGTWIIIAGINGWVGYAGTFGLLALPLIMLGFSRTQVSLAHIGVANLLTINLLDLLPNSSLSPLTWLMAGMIIPAAASLRRKRAPAYLQSRIGLPRPGKNTHKIRCANGRSIGVDSLATLPRPILPKELARLY